MAIESEKRRDEFDERTSQGIVLSDGQTWFFPKPWVALFPVFEPGTHKIKDGYSHTTYGPEFDMLLQMIEDEDGPLERIRLVQSLAALLLLKQYDLTSDELSEPLSFRAGDPVCVNWAQEVLAVATGQSGPKLSPGGGD